MALVMLAYSFLMMQSTVPAQSPSKEGFPPSTRQVTLPGIHRQVLVWLLQDLVLWFIDTDHIKLFRKRRN